MTNCAPFWRLFLFLLLAFSIAGCSQFRRGAFEDDKDPYVIEGRKRNNAMDYDGAIESFERALQSNPANAVAHAELGLLYDQRKNDYVAAIYHYQRHLMLRTNSPMADAIKPRIIACTREVARNVSFAVLTKEMQGELEKISRTNNMLREKVDNLQAELARRPQYVTNYVTNFVTVPTFDQRGSARLTAPTQPAEPPTSELADNEHETAAEPPKRSVPEPETHTPAPKQSARTPPKAVSHTPPSTARNTRTAEKKTKSPAARAVHTVRPGETLAALASRYGVSLKELKAANPGAAGGVRAGQKISIPEK